MEKGPRGGQFYRAPNGRKYYVPRTGGELKQGPKGGCFVEKGSVKRYVHKVICQEQKSKSAPKQKPSSSEKLKSSPLNSSSKQASAVLEKHISAALKLKSKARQVVSCVNTQSYHPRVGHVARKMVIVPVPIEHRKDWSSKNIIFFRSSGTSNEKGLTGMFFPTQGMWRNGWIEKMGHHQKDYDGERGDDETTPVVSDTDRDTIKSWEKPFCKIFKDFMKHIKYDYKEVKRSQGFFYLRKRDMAMTCETAEHIANTYFKYWWMAQLSAAIGGEFWERPDLAFLRGMLLTMDWNPEKQTFLERDKPIRPFDLPEHCNIVDIDQMNFWAQDHDALEPHVMHKHRDQLQHRVRH